MKYFVFWVSIALLSTPAVLADTPKMKVGIIAPLSGNVAAWGNDVRKSALFALNEIAPARFEFIFEDDRCLGGQEGA